MVEPFVSTDQRMIDWFWLLDATRKSRWGQYQTRDQILTAGANSLIFGIYVLSETGANRMVGYARVVTDQAIFSSVTDVIVDEAHRGNGYGTKLMETIVAHPSVKNTVCILGTVDKQEWYKKFGFEIRTGTTMQRDPK